MNLLSFAANALSPVMMIPAQTPARIRKQAVDVWSEKNFQDAYFAKTNSSWRSGHYVTPASVVPQELKADFERFLGRPAIPFDLELEYSPSGFVVNREYLLNAGTIFLLCCRKKIAVADVNLEKTKTFLHGPDYDILCFLLFLATKCSFAKMFDAFYRYGTSTDRIDVGDYEALTFTDFLEIVSDVQIALEDVFVRRGIDKNGL